MDPVGTDHIKALQITIKCKGYIIAKVLVDNGLALNVLPYHIMDQLPIDQSFISPSHIMVRTFDETKRTVVKDLNMDFIY